jgi:hypothetical protein
MVYPVMLPDDHHHTGHAVAIMPAVCRPGSGPRVAAGRFELWICVSCGLTEWYAANVNEALAALAQNPQSGVVYVDGDLPADPAHADE